MKTGLVVLIAMLGLTACGSRSDQTTTAANDQPVATTDSGDAASASGNGAGAALASAAGDAAAAASPPAAFAICSACHSVKAGENRVGPSLAGIVGTKAGDVAGYSFSPALKSSGIKWDRTTLDTWLKGPAAMVPGTKMMIAVSDADKRKAIIDYLETLK